MSNVIPFASAQDSADDVTLALLAACDRLADVLSLTDLIRSQPVREAIQQDVAEALAATKAAMLAAQAYHQHRATMAAEVRQLKQATK